MQMQDSKFTTKRIHQLSSSFFINSIFQRYLKTTSKTGSHGTQESMNAQPVLCASMPHRQMDLLNSSSKTQF